MAKVELHLAGKPPVSLAPEPSNPPWVKVPGERCPRCKGALRVQGRNRQVVGHDLEVAAAHCFDCGEPVGALRVTHDTLFGLEEDEAVLSGPWKVF